MCSKIVPQNRAGQLCGKCTEGYAPDAYSYGIQCADCTDYKYNWIKYVLIAYLPIILLFIVVTIFKLSATAPYMNTFIFFCQMLSSSLYMTLLNGYAAGQSDNMDLKVLTFLYGMWNLDFFRMSFKPLCLHSTVQVISLDYVIACCPLLLILFTYLLVKIHDNSVMIQNIWNPMAWLLAWFSKGSIATSISLIKVFSTFFLLSYVKVLNTSLDLLMPVQAVNMTGHVMGTYSYYNGSLEYFGPEHRPYAILAFTIHVADVQPNDYITTISCDQETDTIQPSVAEGNCTVEISSGLNGLISNDTAATIRVNRGVFGCNHIIEGGRNTTQRLSHSLFLQDGLVLFESSDVTQRSWVILNGVVLSVSMNINGKEGKLQSAESPCASQLIEAYIPVPKVGSYI